MGELGDGRHPELREAVRAACEPFGPAYWRRLDTEREYPDEFVNALTLGGWLSATIPAQYGGSGLGLGAATVIAEEINRSGGNATCCHGQLFCLEVILRHGSPEQKQRWLPRIATGELRLQTLAVTEADSGTDATHLGTTAVKSADGSRFIVNGSKAWASRVRHSDGMLLLARTTPLEEVSRPSEGLSVLLIAVHTAVGQGLRIEPIANMVNQDTDQLHMDHLEVPVNQLIGVEGQGYRHMLDGLNAQRVLAAAECIGDAWWFLDKARHHARERVVFGRPIGRNQGVQFPLAEAYAEAQAANLMRWHACDLYDAGEACRLEASMAKYLAAKASWQAGDACLDTFGGLAFATDHDIERKFRETRVHQVVPMPTNLVLSQIAERALGLPTSF